MENKIPGGYNGKVLRVDLTSEKVTTEPIDASFCRKYLGGTGFIAHYLLTEFKPGIDPLGPENKLIFALGPLTGLPLGGCARHAVGGKSPLTGGVAKSEVGEHWGSQLKRAGFDVVIIEGKAKRPVYLHIHDGEAAIRDANHLWGKNTKETQESIREELGESGVRVAMIGPGGENLVKYACIMHGLSSTAGRGGLGAVMGSKNLKAVTVRGKNLPPVINNAEIKKMIQWLKENMALVKAHTEFGTGAAVGRYAKLGHLPVKNFQGGDFPNADKISAQAIKEKIRVGMESCFACPVRCKKVVEFQEPYQVDRAYGGPEYETLGALGSACGIDNLYAIAKGNELCNAYSLDTISTGFSIAFAMECYERGLLTLDDTGGVRLEFGNAESMLKMIPLIARREGIGNLLAEGSAMAAKQIGHGAEAFAIHVKNFELPLHEPRLSKALGLGYMVNPHGADHMDSLIDLLFSSFGELPNVTVPDLNALGFEPAPLEDIGPRKVRLFKAFQSKRMVADSLVLCDFLPYSLTQMAELTSAVTGYSIDAAELLRVGERIITMLRMYNIREGFTASDDKLPMRFFEPAAGGPLSNKSLDFEEMEKGKRTYYHQMGWNEDGVPTTEKLEELEIDRLAPKK
ncbi:MAG: aor 7 [Deltaproteobacteria bacterium]|nr:aor 7 [Deltaproteobacteria bacterium]